MVAWMERSGIRDGSGVVIPDYAATSSGLRCWQVQDARARFSEFLEASLSEGQQIVTKGGGAAAVLVSIDQWRRLEQMTRPDLKELLLAPEARTDTLTPPREKCRYRRLSSFE